MVRPSDDDIIDDDDDEEEIDSIGIPYTGRVARIPEKNKSSKPSDKVPSPDTSGKIKPVSPT